MRTIQWSLQIGKWNDNPTGTFEVMDSTTDEEIDELVAIEVNSYVSWGWAEIDKPSA